MIIYIARHGQTDINAEHRAQGRKIHKKELYKRLKYSQIEMI